MRLRTFLALNAIGTVGRLTLFLVAGAAFRDQLLDVLEFVQRYQWWLVAFLSSPFRSRRAQAPSVRSAGVDGNHAARTGERSPPRRH